MNSWLHKFSVQKVICTRGQFRIIKITSNRVLRIVKEGITLRNKGRDKSLIISQFKKESGKYLTKKFWYWTQFFFLFFRNMLDKKLWPKPFILHYTDRSLDLLYCTDKKKGKNYVYNVWQVLTVIANTAFPGI